MFLIAITILASPGCDWVMVVDAEVRVDPVAQQAVTTWPQQLLLRHEVLERHSGPAAAYRIAVLCEASAEPVVATWHYGRVNGCGEPSPITGWLEPLDPAAGLPCGSIGGEGELVDPDRRPAADSPSDTVRVFDNGGRCPKGADVVLTIKPAP